MDTPMSDSPYTPSSRGAWPLPDEPDPAMVDSLADLFLGDGSLAPGAGPRLRLTGHGEAERPLPEPGVSEHGGEAVDSIAQARGVHRQKRKARLEAIVLGHLPVLAPAWAMQYAGQRARDLGEPVVLARLAGGTATIEVVGEHESSRVRAEEPVGSLAAAVRRAALRARVWIIRVDELDEPALAEASGLDAITVLTGSDEPAVVACYRTLKGLAHDTAAAQGDDEHAPTLGVAIMGAADGVADRVEQKLRQITRTFLDRADLPTARLPRMIPVSSSTLYRGPCQEPAPVFIAAIRTAVIEAEATGGARASVGLRADRTAVPRGVGDQRPRGGDMRPEPAAKVWAFDDEDWDIEVGDMVADPFDSPAPAPGWSAHDADASGDLGEMDSDDLQTPLPTRLIGGLEPLEFICPYAPSVELAVDGQGRLHLIGLDGGDRHPVGDLMAARAWAHAHAKLLTAADDRILDATHARMHLMTDRPELARGLLDTEVRVHLLAHASTASRGWVARSLNGE